MRALAILLALSLGVVAPAAGADPVVRTFNAPMDRTWTVTESVLKHLGWKIDQADRATGFITTDSRSLDGEDYGVYAKGTRHRLRLQLKADGDKKTSVTVERVVFKRERIMWIDKDEPLSIADQSEEKKTLDTIAKAL
ncbi:MAG TPA: hypothetical protein VLG10_03080 [Methylomirabilota bacterium]|nr:hypothetical protein [Methylomirabilota bacterium]